MRLAFRAFGLVPLFAFAAVAACGSSDSSQPGASGGDDASTPPSSMQDGSTVTPPGSNDATVNVPDGTSPPPTKDGSSGGGQDGFSGGAKDGATAPDAAPLGPSCGYKNTGHHVQISSTIELCLPQTVCTPSETCPRGLADCVNGTCVYKAGYSGLATLPQAWTTQYCDLPSGGCNGAVLNPLPYDVAKSVASSSGNPVCADSPSTTGTCVGVAAPPPMMAGNSQVAIDPSTGKEVPLWGLGMTAASGLCYQLVGPGGTAVVAITDRCAGYCSCNGGSFNECGNCINATDTATQCVCVGTAPPAYNTCCGRGCATTQQCDWCANNNHPHFDLDNATFTHVCGPDGPMFGSCQLTSVSIVQNCYPPNPNWPN